MVLKGGEKIMANKVKADDKKVDKQADKNQPEPVKKKKSSILKIILIVFILLILAATGFAAGIYLKFIDVQALGEKWKLNEYPVIGKYFTEPKTNFEPVDLDQQKPLEIPQNPTLPATTPPVVTHPVVQPEALLPENRIIDDAELKKQAKIKQQEEAKRISKVARYYGTMAPEEAVAILNKMDDETVLVILGKMDDEQVSKILALFDAQRAAVLSQSMLRGHSNNTN